MDNSSMARVGTDEMNTIQQKPILALPQHGGIKDASLLVANKAAKNNGITALYVAAQSGNLDKVKFLLSHGADVNEENATNSNGEVPLHAAVRRGSLDIVKYLIHHGANVNKKDDKGSTPFHVAIHYGHLEVVRYLDTNGAKSNRIRGMTPLYIAAQSGHLDIVQFLISQKADVNGQNDNGQVPLHGAASRGHLDVVRFLIDHGADVNKVTMSGWSPFHAALSCGHRNVLKYLMDNSVHVTKFGGMTPIYIAARAGHLDIVKFLISQGHDLNELNSSGYAAVHGAYIKGHEHVLEYLIRQAEVKQTEVSELDHTALFNSSEPEVVKYVYTEDINKMGKTPLYIAVECGRLDLVKNLIEIRVPVNATNSNGEVPLHAAARGGNLDIVKYLINHGANVNKKDDRGTTPFLVAIHCGHFEVLIYLITKGAKISRVRGMTPLYIAAQSGHLDMIKFLMSQGADVNEQNDSGQVPLHAAAAEGHLEVIQFLVKHGANVDKKTAAGSTPFFHAVSNGHLEVVEYLHKINPVMSRCNGISPLYIAAQNGHLKVVKFLIEAGADVNDDNISGRSPLHAASYAGFLDIVTCLVGKRAHVNAKDRDDWTPLHAAAQEGHKDVVNFLISIGADTDAKDVGGERPRLHLSLLGCPNEHPTLRGVGAVDRDGQEAEQSGRCQGQGDCQKSFKAVGREDVEVDEEESSGSGVKYQLPTTSDFDEIRAQYSSNLEPNLDPVKQQIHSNDVEKINKERNPFIHARSKCPVNKAGNSVSQQTDDSSYIHHQLGIKQGLQHRPYMCQHDQSTILHMTEKTSHHNIIRSGCGAQREQNQKMKGVTLSKVHFIERPTEDKPTAYTSDSRRTWPFLEQNSASYAPSADSSDIDAKKTRQTPSAYFHPRVLRLPSFIEKVMVMVIIHAGVLVFVANGVSADQLILQAGQSSMVPFDIPFVHDNNSQFFPYFTLRFESKQRPFYINGLNDKAGFKFPSQLPRFTTSVAEMASTYCVNININPVDVVDEDVYVLHAIFQSFDSYRRETVITKKILVHMPPGPAKCFITISENNKYPYEVHCEATTGSTETTFTCYQHGRRVEGEGDVTDNGRITRGVFLLPDHTPFSCCSHDVTSAVNITMCNDFKWPPENVHVSHPPDGVPSSTPSIESTIESIGNPEKLSKTRLESQVYSGTCKQFEVSSVSLTITVIINLFLFYTEFVNA